MYHNGVAKYCKGDEINEEGMFQACNTRNIRQKKMLLEKWKDETT
jgi:hypothetical protein